MEEDELDWSTFYSHAWPRMKPYIMMEKGLFAPYYPISQYWSPCKIIFSVALFNSTMFTVFAFFF